MGKNKLQRFAENETFKNLVQPEFDAVFGCDYHLKGNWHASFFGNSKPIVLELGCGRFLGCKAAHGKGALTGACMARCRA